MMLLSPLGVTLKIAGEPFATNEPTPLKLPKQKANEQQMVRTPQSLEEYQPFVRSSAFGGGGRARGVDRVCAGRLMDPGPCPPAPRGLALSTMSHAPTAHPQPGPYNPLVRSVAFPNPFNSIYRATMSTFTKSAGWPGRQTPSKTPKRSSLIRTSNTQRASKNPMLKLVDLNDPEGSDFSPIVRKSSSDAGHTPFVRMPSSRLNCRFLVSISL